MGEKEAKEREKGKKLNNLIVEEIKRIRKEEGLSQAGLAKEIDKEVHMTPIIYAHIEIGRRELKLSELYYICQYFNLSMEKLIQDCYLKLTYENE